MNLSEALNLKKVAYIAYELGWMDDRRVTPPDGPELEEVLADKLNDSFGTMKTMPKITIEDVQLTLDLLVELGIWTRKPPK